MKKRKRAITAAVCLFLCLATFFLIWVNHDYGRYNILGRPTLPPQRVIRQLMLPEAEEVYRSERDSIIYDAGEYLLALENGMQNYSLCRFENGAAVLSPMELGIGYINFTNNDMYLPFYAYTRSPEAVSAELEIYVSRTKSSYSSGEHHELHCILPSESCTDGLASFTLRMESADSHTSSLIYDFWHCLDWGSIVNAVYYKMDLRFFDAKGELISESGIEMGEKES